eukprot:TRINITY_DN45222_c0_g1_i1.p1 TRINITY_DN45222_c0_g1~~TRINITY_DN45222_c0_g1_i1.p1  ORF type:complete len:504 (-),score=69.16 TRINITY_DN45222_c0_g1_i1:275-1786(-)
MSVRDHIQVLWAALTFCLIQQIHTNRVHDVASDEQKANSCGDILPGAELRDWAWTHSSDCKCPKGSLIAGDALECIKKQGQRYFSSKDVKMRGKCECAFKVVSQMHEATDDSHGTGPNEGTGNEAMETMAWDCAMYEEAGFEAGDIVRIEKKSSKLQGTIHVVVCPQSRRKATEGRICLQQGYRSSGCWAPHHLRKMTDTKIDSFQMALKQFTGRAELTLANFYSAAKEPGAWDLENAFPTLYNMAGIAQNFGTIPPTKDLIRFWETNTCDARFPSPIGRVTVGISYTRSATVDQTIEKLVGAELQGALGPIVRSKLLANRVGASYEKINDQIASQAPNLVVNGLKDRFFDVASTNTQTSRYGKKGLLLIEFTVCKVTSQVRFFQCHVSKDSTWIGRGTSGDLLATSFWRLLSNVPGLGYVLNPIIMNGITSQLPGQIMHGLSAQVGEPNVCIFEGGIQEAKDRTQEMFHDLLDITKCPQAQAEKPQVPPDACEEPKTAPPTK